MYHQNLTLLIQCIWRWVWKMILISKWEYFKISHLDLMIPWLHPRDWHICFTSNLANFFKNNYVQKGECLNDCFMTKFEPGPGPSPMASGPYPAQARMAPGQNRPGPRMKWTHPSGPAHGPWVGPMQGSNSHPMSQVPTLIFLYNILNIVLSLKLIPRLIHIVIFLQWDCKVNVKSVFIGVHRIISWNVL